MKFVDSLRLYDTGKRPRTGSSLVQLMAGRFGAIATIGTYADLLSAEQSGEYFNDIKFEMHFNSLPRSAAYMRQWTG